MYNTIYLNRSKKLIVHSGEHQLPHTYLATAMKNIEQLGFTFSERLIDVLRTLSIDEFTDIYLQLVKDLRSVVGADVRYRPMYPQFPQQVMLTHEAELYINAILHYLSCTLPKYEAIERFPLLDEVELKVIELGSTEEFYHNIRQLIQANSSLSESDKADIEWVIANNTTDVIDSVLPNEIPVKENVGFVVGSLLKYDRANLTLIQRYVKTATDVLRLAVAMSEGDISLATNTKFRKFKRVERRLILGLLEGCDNIIEDMLRYKLRWIRLGEILHPGEYKNQYFKCREAFDILRNDKPYATFNGKLEDALGRHEVLDAIELLKNRAGEFARRLDHLLRIGEETSLVVEAFKGVVHQVSTPVLLQVIAHFSHRNEEQELRTFFPKGNVAKAVAINDTLPTVDATTCEELVLTCQGELIQRFAKQSALGKVYIDKRLQQYVVPFSQRSASKSLRTIVRGSKLTIPGGNTIRFFTWWKEGFVGGKHTDRVDIDLSAVMYDDKWQYIEHISYTNLRSSQYKAAHSGDITSAPYGACEFIDIDIPSVLQYGGRYIIPSLNSFTGQPFCDLPECSVGWMMRSHPQSGEIFEPSTVIDKLDISADTRISIPIILDLLERKVVWTDLALKAHPQYSINVEGNQTGMVTMGKAMTTLRKPNLYDLFMLHIKARGELVERLEEADTIYSLDTGITPFEIETIMSEYMM